MKFSPLVKDNVLFGWESRQQGAYFFFGSDQANRDNLPKLFPQYQFAYLKQVHGHQIVDASPDQVFEADGHQTTSQKLALCIQTADCLPVLFSNGSQALAVHAGWRGLVAEIIPKAWQQSLPSDSWAVAVGPHIKRESFEVGQDVAQEIEGCLKKSAPELTLLGPHIEPDKFYVDLSLLAKSQIDQGPHPLAQFYISPENTFTSNELHSYRRDHKKAGRQISFVALDETVFPTTF